MNQDTALSIIKKIHFNDLRGVDLTKTQVRLYCLTSNKVAVEAIMFYEDGLFKLKELCPMEKREVTLVDVDEEYPIIEGENAFFTFSSYKGEPEYGKLFFAENYKLAESDGVFYKAYTYTMPDNVVTLTNGKFLILHYGKYCTDLCFTSYLPGLKWKKIEASDLNLPKGDLSYMRGRFFVSKKGTKCFEVDINGPHILLRDEWGGCFNSYKGRTLPEDGSRYYKRARSNGGGAGYDYAIYDYGWRNCISEDDI